MAAHNKLTTLQVKNAKPGTDKHGRPSAKLYLDGSGLYLHVGATGGKSWVFRYTLNGKSRDMGLGRADVFSLAEARERALAARKLVADGIDPLNVKSKPAVTVPSFKDCAERYINAQAPGWKNEKHAWQWGQTLSAHVYPILGDLPVDQVDTAAIQRCLTQGEPPLWLRMPETATRIRGRIEAVLGWATTMGHRTGDNPARWKNHLDNLLPARNKVDKVKHHDAMPYADVPAFLPELQGHAGIAARTLEFAILTAARTGEVIGATWSEIDLEKRLWTVPAERMKAAQEHVVPLSDRAVGLLESLERKGAKLFPISNMAMLMLLRKSGHSDITVHGFRSSFRNWCEETGVRRELAEAALSHQVGDKTEAAYNRTRLIEQRRTIMQAWADFCFGQPTTGNVIQLRA